MFAGAFFDRDEGMLTLFRDRLGQKPLYLYRDQADLLFASELKAYPRLSQAVVRILVKLSGLRDTRRSCCWASIP